MRAAVFGRQLITVNNEFIACNIGYNYYSEHENDAVECLRERLNIDTCIHIDSEIKPGLRHKANVNKKVNKDKVLMGRWKNTPFCDDILMPSMPYYRREITIKNDDLKGEYHTFLLDDGDYTLLSLAPHFTLQKKLGMRKIFSEGEFFYLPDYQNYRHNLGYYFYANNQKVRTGEDVTGTWADDGVIMFFKSNAIVDSFCEALKAGNIALVKEEKRLFKDRGCCFINLEAAYRT